MDIKDVEKKDGLYKVNGEWITALEFLRLIVPQHVPKSQRPKALDASGNRIAVKSLSSSRPFLSLVGGTSAVQGEGTGHRFILQYDGLSKVTFLRADRHDVEGKILGVVELNRFITWDRFSTDMQALHAALKEGREYFEDAHLIPTPDMKVSGRGDFDHQVVYEFHPGIGLRFFYVNKREWSPMPMGAIELTAETEALQLIDFLNATLSRANDFSDTRSYVARKDSLVRKFRAHASFRNYLRGRESER